MEHLLVFGLCGFFPLFLSISSNFCGLQYLEPGLDKADNVSSENSDALEAPWLVNIYGNGERCQGIILSSWWVLTAANCFLLMNPSQVELTESPGHISTKTVRQFLLHRGFSAGNKAPNNDLGLIMLDQPVDLNIEDMWLACIPQEEKPYDTQEECRIIERGQEGSVKLFPKATAVKPLSLSDCEKHWPEANELRNLCVARKDHPKEKLKRRLCKVLVGSPVICRDPFTQEWEVMGIVSQSLPNCKAPILASQVLSHLHWLKRVGAIENLLQPEETREEPAGEQLATLPKPDSVQTPLATLLVPVTFPHGLHVFKLPPQQSASILLLQVVEENLTTTTGLPTTKAPAVETSTTTKAQLETGMTTTLSLNQTTNVSLTTTNLTMSPSTNVTKPSQEASNIISTAGHQSSPITSTSPFSESKTATIVSTNISSTPTQQSSVTSTTAYQSPSLAASTTNQTSVKSSTSKSPPQTPANTSVSKSAPQTTEPEHVTLKTTGQAPQTASSVTEKSSLMTTPTPTPTQSLNTSSVVTHHHLVILPPTTPKQTSPSASPNTTSDNSSTHT